MKITIDCLFVAILCVLTSQNVYADSVTIEVDVPSKPDQAVGLLISPDNIVQKNDASLSKTASGKYAVTYAFDKAEIKPDTLASAMVTTTDGGVIFGNMVIPLSAEKTDPLPACTERVQLSSAVSGQVGVMASVVDIRTQRREEAKKKIRPFLTGAPLEKLIRLEKALGLETTPVLSDELAPAILIDRLSRIQAALALHLKKQL